MALLCCPRGRTAAPAVTPTLLLSPASTLDVISTILLLLLLMILLLYSYFTTAPTPAVTPSLLLPLRRSRARETDGQPSPRGDHLLLPLSLIASRYQNIFWTLDMVTIDHQDY